MRSNWMWQVGGALAAGLMVVGCTSVSDAADTTVTATSALNESSDVAHAPKLGGLPGFGPDLGTGLFLGGEDRAFHCDSTPETTTVDVCGAERPATTHYEWTSCSPPALPDGGTPPGPPPGKGSSVGTADISYTYTLEPADTCDETTALTTQRVATFSIERGGPHGRGMKESGSTTSTSTHGLNATDYTETIEVDTTRARLEEDGSTLDSMHITGTITVAFAGTGDALIRTFSGTTTAELSTGDSHTVVLTDVVRPAPTVCFWPTSGSVARTGSDGTTHTLVFSSTCGQATLDGEAFTLRAGGPGGHGRGGKRPPM